MEEAAFFAAARAAAMEAEYEMERHRAASKMQRRQRGILARQRYVEMREERTVEEGRERSRARMRKLRFALRVHASTVRATRQLAEEAAMRRERLRGGSIQGDGAPSRCDPNGRSRGESSRVGIAQGCVRGDMLLVAYGLKRRIGTKYLDGPSAAAPEEPDAAPARGCSRRRVRPRRHRAVDAGGGRDTSENA